MCLAIPMKLLQKNKFRGDAELGGVKRNINLILVPHVKIGDYVIVHAGAAIEILDEIEAENTLTLFREMDSI